MNCRNILSLGALTAVGLALLPSNAISQTKSLKDQLVGTWTLVSFGRTAADGTMQKIANPKGIMFFDASGRYAFMAERGERPNFKIPSQPTTEELAAATQDFFAANYGTWSVSDADKTLTLRYDGALRPNNEKTDVKDTVKLTGDELELVTNAALATGANTDQTFRRAK